MEEKININQILRMLPQRYPFILVDRVVEYTDFTHLVALKNVTANEPYFLGHFPERPVMPGVLMLEALAQAALLLWHLSVKPSPEQEFHHFFAGIDKARFKQVVMPGDQLYLEVTSTSRKREFWQMQAEAKVEGKIVCTAELMSAAKEIIK